jgi:hypothetical protein
MVGELMVDRAVYRAATMAVTLAVHDPVVPETEVFRVTAVLLVEEHHPGLPALFLDIAHPDRVAQARAAAALAARDDPVDSSEVHLRQRPEQRLG